MLLTDLLENVTDSGFPSTQTHRAPATGMQEPGAWVSLPPSALGVPGNVPALDPADRAARGGHWSLGCCPLYRPQHPPGPAPSTCQSSASLGHISCSLIWGQSPPSVPTPVQGPKAQVCVRHAFSALQIAHFTHGTPGSWVSAGDPRSLAQDTNATAGCPVLRLAPACKHHLPVLFLPGVSGYPEVSPVPSTLHTSAWTSP